MAFTLTSGRVTILLGGEFFVPDVLTIIIAYIFLLYGVAGSSVFALSQGLFVDLFSGGVNGIFTLLYLSVCGGILLCSRFLNIHSPRGQATIVCLVMTIKYLSFFLVMKIFSQLAIFSSSFLWVALTTVLITAVTAPLFFNLFDRLNLVKYT
ncbi:conserved membrane hypothetical protein [uncultured Desulfobacterium sp.]|uniref:Rod shape-determining protein MreD n=1 Tax=uncultured Desulfobacterium sp. TaxID=201089 RepID=A0A445N387_9BACT|nr:conserved membrane hypothetical protein [uncultured Desulfobacterium sp.]